MVCTEGHVTSATDFCDVCGSPMDQVTPEDEPSTSGSVDPHVCPNCGAPRVKSALFCESCGYDYTTGALPQQDLRTELGLSPVSVLTDEAVANEQHSGPTDSIDDTAEASCVVDGTADAESQEPGPSIPEGHPTKAGEESSSPEARPTDSLAKRVPHVAEVWIDPQWYAFQESSDPLPPQCPPRIIPLRESALIGRRSASRNIHPDIDCEPDSGCSRRQAYLTSADGYWYINDLDSANGTFVAPATASLPDEPITGRTQITPDSRIYVGAWTRIVIRPASEADATQP